MISYSEDEWGFLMTADVLEVNETRNMIARKEKATTTLGTSIAPVISCCVILTLFWILIHLIHGGSNALVAEMNPHHLGPVIFGLLCYTPYFSV